MNNKQSVLIIEDSPLVVKMLRNILKGDYEIFSELSGAAGYKTAVDQKPDIILLDVIMSGMDGYEVCKKLKKNSLTKNIPVIFISSLDEMEDERKGLEIGAIDYITKPFNEPIVKIRVKNHLELKRNRDILSELSSLDGLTGLYNRRYFDKAVEQEWQKSKLNNTPFSIMLMDIDYFKIYNDSYGHLEGDECLKMIAQRIKTCVNSKSTVAARFGGEEFVCLMINYGLESALELSNNILKCIHELKIPFPLSKTSEIVTISIGLGLIYPKETSLLTDFYKNVDDLLYKAKRNGRNQIQYEIMN